MKWENAAQYLQSLKTHTIGGSSMAKRQMIAEGQFDEITRRAKEANDFVKRLRREAKV